MSDFPCIRWMENDQECSARWRSESGLPPPKRVQLADDRMTADAAFRLASEGTALLWRGDYQNARQLLQAMARRADAKPRKKNNISPSAPITPLDAFNTHRQTQSQRARTLGMVLLPFLADYSIPLRRAPDVRVACAEAWGPASEETAGSADEGSAGKAAKVSSVATFRELLGLIGAHEWHKKGVDIPVLGARIHPAYGVFSPVRGEYLELVAKAPLPATTLAFDIGTGTGVLTALLAQRGVQHIVATDLDPRALRCANENLTRLNLIDRVELLHTDLFPPGRAPLVVCNPPWVPARPSSPVEYAIFDPDSRMLRGFLNGLSAHLTPSGEGWLILSDLAEHLGLRSRPTLLEMIASAGLKVVGRDEIRPQHPKVMDLTDALHTARAAEVTSLWRLAAL